MSSKQNDVDVQMNVQPEPAEQDSCFRDRTRR